LFTKRSEQSLNSPNKTHLNTN